MKKCSHTAHHSLTELNITPLLDLAFVLLVIFIITTTPIANDLGVALPTASKRAKEPKPRLHYVTIESTGKTYLDRGEVPDLAALRERLIALRVDEPDLNIVLRGDAHAKYQRVVGVIDMLQQANVGKVNLATDPFPDGALKKK